MERIPKRKKNYKGTTKETTKETTKDMEKDRGRTIGQMKEETHTARKADTKEKEKDKEKEKERTTKEKERDVDTNTTKEKETEKENSERVTTMDHNLWKSALSTQKKKHGLQEKKTMCTFGPKKRNTTKET